MRYYPFLKGGFRPPAFQSVGWQATRRAYLAAALVLLLTAIFAAGCVVDRNPITGKKRAYGYSWAQEVQLGQQSDQQIQAQYGIYQDPELTAYVNRIGEKVLQQSHLRRPDTPAEFKNTPFTFRVLDSPIVNAFALPGGFVYVTRGLMTHLENEAQLAVVLGHEVGHVAARHSSQRAFESQLGQIGLIGGAVLGQEVLGLPAGDLLNLGSTATQLLFLSYGRDDERESDNLGVDYAALAGYKASEGAAFFRSLKRMGAQQGSSIPSFLSTHPDPGEREQTIPKLYQQWEGKVADPIVDTRDLFNVLEGMVMGENPRNGFTENNMFYHPDLRFQFPVPNGFIVQNGATQVAMIEQNQQAIMLFADAQSIVGQQVSSAQAAAQTFGSQQGLQVIESGAARSSNLPASFVLAGAQTQQGGNVRLLAYFIEYGKNIWGFLGYSSEQGFATYQNHFQRTMQGFSALTDSRILNIQPARVEIVAAPRTAAFSTFVPANLPSGISAQDLAIINQVELNETIQKGELLKLPTK